MLQLVVGGVDNFDVFFKAILVETRRVICRIIMICSLIEIWKDQRIDSLYEVWEVLDNDRRL